MPRLLLSYCYTGEKADDRKRAREREKRTVYEDEVKGTRESGITFLLLLQSATWRGSGGRGGLDFTQTHSHRLNNTLIL